MQRGARVESRAALARASGATTIFSGCTHRARRRSDRRHEDAPRDHHARRPAPRDALAVAELRVLPDHAPLACAVAIIRWGRGRLSDGVMRARCTACAKKGATTEHPGWGGADVGFLPFPGAPFSGRFHLRYGAVLESTMRGVYRRLKCASGHIRKA